MLQIHQHVAVRADLIDSTQVHRASESWKQLFSGSSNPKEIFLTAKNLLYKCLEFSYSIKSHIQDYFLKAKYVFSSPYFWFGLLLIPITALLADFIYNW